MTSNPPPMVGDERFPGQRLGQASLFIALAMCLFITFFGVPIGTRVFVGIVAIAGCIVAVILGHMSRKRSKMAGARNKEAMFGLIIGYLQLVIRVPLLLLLLLLIRDFG